MNVEDKWILDGHTPVKTDLYTWAAFFEKIDNRRVARDEIGDGVVSTVFLGIDHNWGFEGPPLLFETMALGGPLDQEMERYATWDEAEAGHKEMVERVRAALSESAP